MTRRQVYFKTWLHTVRNDKCVQLFTGYYTKKVATNARIA